MCLCEQQDIRNKGHKYWSALRGVFLALLSGIFISTGSAIVKYMCNIPTGQLAVYRFLALLSFSLPAAVNTREKMFGPPNMRWLLVLRGIFGATNIYLNFIAFRILPLGEASVIIFSVPVFVTLSARVLLKEPCGISQALTIVFTILGIVLISGSGFNDQKNNQMYGYIAAVASLFFSTGRYIVLRKIRSVHRAITIFNFAWIAVLETTVLTYAISGFRLHDCGIQQFYIVLMGVLSYGGQIFLTTALQCEQAGPIATVRSASDIILSFMWQILLFEQKADGGTIVGAVLVSVSILVVGVTKWVTSLPEDSPTKHALLWITK